MVVHVPVCPVAENQELDTARLLLKPTLATVKSSAERG